MMTVARRRGNLEGSITRRKDGLWQGAVIIGYDAEGKGIRKFFYGRTRKELQAKVSEITNRVKSGTYTETKIALGAWIRTWLDNYVKASVRPTTWESYNSQFELHINPALGMKRIDKVKTSDLQLFYTDKLKDGSRMDGKAGGLSPTTVRYLHKVLRQSLAQAQREGMIARNPADYVTLPKQEKPEIQTLTLEQVGAFLKAAKGSRHYPAFLLELATGLRRGELLALRWQDVDSEAGTITVNRGVVRTKQGLVFQKPKTKLSQRTITIPNNVVRELSTHKRKQAEQRLMLGEAYHNMDLVFPTEDGKVIDPQNFVRSFREVLVKAVLPKITFHSLRHSYAILCLQEGVDIKTIQENLGHHKAAFTLDVYSSATSKMKQEASTKIGNLIASCLE